MRKVIYLDNAATTKVDKDVLKAMLPYFTEKYGNASSLHSEGQKAKKAMEDSRMVIAESINAKPEEITFTSGGTESDNLAIKGLALAYPEKRHIITSEIEHPAVLETCEEMQKQGYKVSYIGVDKEGIINPNDIEKAIQHDTLVVSVMHVNNEVGAIQPIENIAALCRKHNVFFHTDAVQSLSKLEIDVKKQNIDLLSASAHKINGPKGVGFLYVRNGIKIKPIINGGGHEFGKRSGTENVAGIVGMAKAVELANAVKNQKSIKKIRDALLNNILRIKGARLNGSREKRIYNNINVSFDGIEGESLLMLLDKAGIAVSTGSACSSQKLEPSHVLKAIGLSDMESHGSIRITLSNENTQDEMSCTLNNIKHSVERLREISGSIKI